MIAELAWLAGIIDGEGCFTVKRPIKKAKGSGYTPYQLWLVLCNTNEAMVVRAKEIFEKLGATPQPIRKVWKGEKATRWQFWLHVAKKKDLLIVTEALLPYLVAKRTEAEIVRWFLIRSCQDRAHRTTPLEAEFLDMLSLIKRNGGEAPSELKERIREVIPSQATLGIGGVEGVETRQVSPNNNPVQECPAPLRGDDIVRHSDENRRASINS